MALNKKTIDDINVKGRRVLVRCDFNVPLKDGAITDETRIVAALPTIKKLMNDGGRVILCSHLGKVKNGPNEGESLAPVAKSLSEKLGKEVVFVNDYHVTGEAAAKAVEAMKDGDVILLQNTRFRGAEETKNGEGFSRELADLADDYVCDAFGSSHRAHASVAGEHPRIGEWLPARHHGVHDFVDIVKLPPLRFVIGVAQRLPEKLFGADHAAGVVFQKALYLPGLRVLRHEILLHV